MEVTLIIVGGLVAVTLIAAVGDYLTKARVAAASRPTPDVSELQARVERLEQALRDHEAKLGVLEADVSFTAKLLEKRD